MSKQVNWEANLGKVEREIDLLKALISTKQQEKVSLENIIANGGVYVETSLPTIRKINEGNPVAEVAIQNLNQEVVKRGRGRPKGSKNKPKHGDTNVKPVVTKTVVVEDEMDLEELPARLEEIGQSTNRPIKLDDFVRILRKEGFPYDSKAVKVELLNLVRIGKFIRNDDEERSYEYVKAGLEYGF